MSSSGCWRPIERPGTVSCRILVETAAMRLADETLVGSTSIVQSITTLGFVTRTLPVCPYPNRGRCTLSRCRDQQNSESAITRLVCAGEWMVSSLIEAFGQSQGSGVLLLPRRRILPTSSSSSPCLTRRHDDFQRHRRSSVTVHTPPYGRARLN